MKLSLETVARIYAAGRNYASVVVGFATSLGLISASQSKTLTESLAEVWNGLAQVGHGLTSIWQVLVIVGGPTVAAAIAWYAQRSAKTVNTTATAAAVANNPADPNAAAAKDALAKAADSVTGLSVVKT